MSGLAKTDEMEDDAENGGEGDKHDGQDELR